MFENLKNIFKKFSKKEDGQIANSKEAAKERLHLVLMQDRANVSADFLELMKQEIIEVIKKYIDVDEKAIDVRLTNKENTDGTNGAPALYANIPILNIKNEARKANPKEVEEKSEEQNADSKEEQNSDKEENAQGIKQDNSDKIEETNITAETEEKDENIENNDAENNVETDGNNNIQNNVENNEINNQNVEQEKVVVN